jgi:FAD/FMN-containing dehydrogenase/Fe-S oxidoreductase
VLAPLLVSKELKERTDAMTTTPPAQTISTGRAGRRAKSDAGAAGAVNRGRIAAELTRAVDGEVRFDEGSRHLYANDASLYRQVPIGVVIPRHADDVLSALAVCRTHGAPVLGRGGGTALAGQSVNAAVMFDFSKYMNQILDLDVDARTARVQPGVICDQLRGAAGKHGLTFAPDPATHDHNTLGGMIGNNSCGTHSVMGGKTVDNVISLDVITYDGTRMQVGPTSDADYERVVAAGGRPAEIYRDLRALRDHYGQLVRDQYPAIPRRVSGYNLDDLLPEKGFNLARALVGSESTCVLVLEATVRLLPDPPKRSLLVVGFPDIATAAEGAPVGRETDVIGLECFDVGVIRNLRVKGGHMKGMDELPEGSAWLLAEYGGDTQDEADAKAREFADKVHERDMGHAKLFDDPQSELDVWEVRRGAIGSTRIPGEHPGLPGWEDAAVEPTQLADYLRDYQELMQEFGYHSVLFGHFGQGCVHNRLDLDIATAEGIATFKRFIDRAADLCVRYGGSLSGEHGDGQLRAALLSKMYSQEVLDAFARFKSIFDPDLAMNPGKIVHPYRPDQNLRLGTDYRPLALDTNFSFHEDDFSFAEAANRCFGVGKCRHLSGGTMCPSFMVTREEKNSTRGRARLLFEMIQDGDKRKRGKDAWRDENVKDSLDLCLACKGCKGDCPVSVDMATYKAEFLSHYYEGRLRPRAAYAMGLIPIWARIASYAPGLANTLSHSPVLGTGAKLFAGVSSHRQAPSIAGQTFVHWFGGHPPANADGPPVLVWPDTFTNYFNPQVGIAATEVLEAAGFRVRIPEQALCCGRPLYDYGMLPTAKRWMQRTVAALRTEIEDGVPLVGLEPSCLAAFRDELTNLLPHDADARRLSQQSYLLAELLQHKAPDFSPPTLRRKAIYQLHCHHGAIMGAGSEKDLMARMELQVDYPDSGCCGMAGSFGYEAGEKYDVSVACGERAILPTVREAPADTVIIADGFSCREQIAQLTDRRALHLAQAMQLGLRHGPDGPPGEFLECTAAAPEVRAGRKIAVAAAAGTALAGATVAGRSLRRART